MQKKSHNSTLNQYIVGIGASAGGLEAILELFDSIPQDISCSFIIVQHLSPDYKSMMPELLEKHTKMNIQEAKDGMIAKPNSIYVIPHKKNMTFRFGKLMLTDKIPNKAPNSAIDIFLTSLAEDRKEKAIGIILSGTGSDGSRGLEAIKKEGGLALVQDPITAKFDGMPNSAINTGCVDFVLSPEMMPEEILHHINADTVKLYPSPITENDEELLTEILNIVKIKSGQDFALYKRPTIARRIAKRVSYLHLDSLADYKDHLSKNDEEATVLTKEFFIGVTRFFRDEKAFEKLSKEVIPEIIKQKNQGDIIKIWVAGCSTGEEAYTLAMIVDELLRSSKKEIEVKIFATDIDKEAIDVAARGLYPYSINKDVSPERLKAFFEEAGNKYKVSPYLRKMVVFAQHDLVRNAPYGKMDLISCRNLLIYLSPILQKSIFAKFHFSLTGQGYLFLGPSESLGEYESAFVELDKKWKIYRNSGSHKKLDLKDFATLGNVNTFMTTDISKVKSDKVLLNSSGPLQALNDILLKECDFGAVYINESFELIQASGVYHQYLHLPKNNLDLNILKMLPDDLSALLGSGIRKAAKINKKVVFNGIKVRIGRKTRTVDTTVVPVQDKKFLKKFFWVLFKETSVAKDKKDTFSYPLEDFSNHTHLAEIEQELFETKEHLQSAIEELETSNEEMQSSNEELVSANEELQSTNEELQSLNEELHTVNTEHQLKIKELIELNDDLNNYFRSTDIGKVFIDKNLLIRKYTPAVVKQINLISLDVGRPISHISNNIQYENLVGDIHKVMSRNEMIEREIQAKNQRWYLMRILPYIKQDKSVDGAIITFIDITSSKNLNLLLSGVLNSSLNAIMAFKVVRNKKEEIEDFECIMTNAAGERITKVKSSEIVGKGIVSNPVSKQAELFEVYKKVVETGQPLHIEYFHKELSCWLEIAAVKMEEGLAVTFGDITEKRHAEEKIKLAYEELSKTQTHLKKLNNELEERVEERTQELSISEERFKILSLATNDAIWDWDFVSNKVWWNEGFKKIFGYSGEEVDGGVESWFNKIHPDDKERVINGIQDVISNGQKLWSGEYRLLKADGTYATILDRAYVLHYEDGSPYRMIGSMVDLTHLKRVQTELKNTNQNLVKINTDLDNFVYTASHDLKAPISNIEGLINALQEMTETGNEEVSGILEMIRKSVQRFKDTINALTDVAKIQKEFEEDAEILDIKEMIEEVKFSIQHMFDSSDAKIEYRLDVKRVKFSKKNFRSILYNLISNAIKYKEEKKAPIIEIASRKVEDHIELVVKDNGLGIDNTRIKQIFGMFKRFHTHVEGTGIGLYMVKRMIENAGGTIQVESKPGEGSSFKICLQDDIKQQKNKVQAA